MVPTALMRIFIVVDDDISGIASVADNLSSGSYEVWLRVPAFSLSLGQYIVAFYVVNDVGFVSNPVGGPFQVVPAATPTTAQRPRLTRCPMPSQTPAPYPSPFPSICLLRWNWYRWSFANFDIYWEDVDEIATSSDGHGTVLRGNNERRNVINGSSVTLLAVTLQSMYFALAPSANLLVFRLTNQNLTPMTGDIAVYADTTVGSDDWHSISFLADDQGLWWGGSGGHASTALVPSVPGITWLLT
jgi:hypothetical protein